jgi:hypothetical protein
LILVVRAKSFTSEFNDQHTILTSKKSVPVCKHTGICQVTKLVKKLTHPIETSKAPDLLYPTRDERLASTNDTLEIRLRADSGNGKDS